MVWHTSKLGDVCEMIKRGIAPKYVEDDGVLVINQKCIRDHSVNYDLARQHNSELKKVSEERYIKAGDVLVNSTGTGTLGRVAQVRLTPDEPVTVDTHVTIVRPKPDLFYSDFFGYMLIKIEEEITAAGEGASGQTELPRTKLENEFFISYPDSLTEQKRIVAILDQAFADIDKARALTEQNLKNARELFDSYLQQVFSQRGDEWIEKAISDLGLVQTGSTPKTSDKENFGDFVPFIKPGHFQENGEIVLTDEGLSEKGRNASRVIPEKSVLMVCIGATIGKCGFVDEEVTCNQQINALTPDGEINHRFAYYQMLLPEFQNKVIQSSGQATLPIINKKKWSSLKLTYPEISMQLDIIHKLDNLKADSMSLIELYNLKLAKLDSLKKSLLQKAFSGELTKDKQEAA